MNKLLSIGLLLLLSFTAQAGWQLQNEQSSINFVSIKKSTVGEVHAFNSLSGTLNGNKVQVKIDLSSVNTNIPIRNDRMKTMLFDVANFSTATIDAMINQSKLTALKSGDSYQEAIKLTLNLHGINKEIATTVQVIKLSNGSVIVNSISPIIIKASDFDLSDGIEALRKVAKLPVISSAVPITFNLVFSK